MLHLAEKQWVIKRRTDILGKGLNFEKPEFLEKHKETISS